ncbi:MAG: hypothetical protein QXV09_07930, partial [Candidatus Bathyarchaeia archaeon]
ECILLSGGPGVRRVEEFTVQVDVSDDSFALEVLDARWYDGSVGPNTYGAYLIITIRDVYVDGLKGAVLELNLPEGIYNSADNSSRVKAAPISMQLPQPLQLQDLSEIISTLLSAQQSSSAQVYGRGDVLTFMFSLNLFNVSVGNHAIEGVLSYIDSWGSYREISVPILVAVLGRTEYIEIVMDRSINIKSRYVNASLTLTNRGSSPVYDAYVVLSPFQGTPILIASPAVNYIEKIDPEEICEVPLTLAYNPIGFYYQTGGSSSITYGTVPMTVSIFYRDVSGYSRVFNNTITVVVEPFIDLMVRNVKATGTNATSTLTGILVNYGSSTAYRVEVELIVGDAVGWSLIGDVDPGSEVAFRLDVSKYNESAVLTVKYYNMFNELESKGMNVSIALQEETETPSTQQEQLPIERWIIVVGVIVFLAVATVLIYKMMKKSKIPNET